MENESEKRIQWHPAFCSAMKLELIENKNDLDYINEYNLNTKPLQIDLLVIRKAKNISIHNEIGKFFRGHNIMEYKSPEDSLNVDTYYKTQAYACLYKANEPTINAIDINDITLTIIRNAFPRELMNFFKNNGFEITHPYEGIFYIKKGGLFDTQLVISRNLKGSAHIWIKSLTNKMPKQTVKELIQNLNALHGNEEKNYGDSVLNVAMQANPISFDILKKEDNTMCEALRNFFADELNQKLDEQAANHTVTYVENAAKNFNTTIEAACKALDISIEDYRQAKVFIENTAK